MDEVARYRDEKREKRKARDFSLLSIASHQGSSISDVSSLNALALTNSSPILNIEHSLANSSSIDIDQISKSDRKPIRQRLSLITRKIVKRFSYFQSGRQQYKED